MSFHLKFLLSFCLFYFTSGLGMNLIETAITESNYKVLRYTLSETNFTSEQFFKYKQLAEDILALNRDNFLSSLKKHGIADKSDYEYAKENSKYILQGVTTLAYVSVAIETIGYILTKLKLYEDEKNVIVWAVIPAFLLQVYMLIFLLKI